MSAGSLDQRFAEAMGQLLGPDFPSHIGLAVSGGGDSMAMLALAHNWARVWGPRLWVITVDHGLRPEGADEAAMVAEFCAELGHPHATLGWRWDGTGNLQDAARRARLDLIDRWRRGLGHVLMAHTADDLAETLLLRLARGSGVEGLAAMAAKRRVTPNPERTPEQPPGDVGVGTAVVPPEAPGLEQGAGFEIIRPCLGMSRAELRHYIRTLRVQWAEDPSNEDPRFDRVRARRLLATLEPLGLSADDLVATAHRMRRASEALWARAASVAGDIAQEAGGCVILDRAGFEGVERDTQLRLLSAACMWVSGAEYRPRAASLEDLLDRLLGGGAGTLIGAKAETHAAECRIFREASAIPRLRVPPGALWDRRWRVTGPPAEGAQIGALGEGIRDCPDWRATGLPRAALIASPAVWRGDELVAAPVAGLGREWSARIVTPFTNYLVSH